MMILDAVSSSGLLSLVLIMFNPSPSTPDQNHQQQLVSSSKYTTLNTVSSTYVHTTNILGFNGPVDTSQQAHNIMMLLMIQTTKPHKITICRRRVWGMVHRRIVVTGLESILCRGLLWRLMVWLVRSSLVLMRLLGCLQHVCLSCNVPVP